MTVTDQPRPDDRVIAVFHEVIARLELGATGSKIPVEFTYRGGVKNPLTSQRMFVTGTAPQYTLDYFDDLMGDDGYLDFAEWHPRGRRTKINMSVGRRTDCIYIHVNTPSHHYMRNYEVGMRDTRFREGPVNLKDELAPLRKLVANEKAMVAAVLEIVRNE